MVIMTNSFNSVIILRIGETKVTKEEFYGGKLPV